MATTEYEYRDFASATAGGTKVKAWRDAQAARRKLRRSLDPAWTLGRMRGAHLEGPLIGGDYIVLSIVRHVYTLTARRRLR